MRNAICPTPLHFRKLASHFVSLSSGDRLLRFGWVATDVDLVSYVQTLFDPAAGVLAVVEPDGDISGVLHLEFTDAGAHLGLSVSSWARNQGIGTLLLRRAGLLARARGFNALFARSLGINTALQRLALHIGMNVAPSPGALIARSGPPATGARDAAREGFCGRITLLDHTLRSLWDGSADRGSHFGSPKPAPSDLAQEILDGRLAVQ
jgi:GNAT superfamily N-acetyltransferase